MADPIASLGYFTGINNVDDPVRLASMPVKIGAGGYKAAYPLVKCVNLDIDNTYALSSRDGSIIKVSGTDIHSSWSDGEIGFFVDGVNLYLINSDYSITQLLSGLTNGARMSYFKVNDRIYMTNGVYIGYFHYMSMNSLVNPGKTYKVPLPAGQRIAYYKGVLFVAKGKVLYISDALCDHYDVRTGFRVFTNDITMVRPVDTGIYVADGETWFLVEKRAFADEPAEFRKEPVLEADTIPFTDVVMDGEYFGEGEEGDVAIWTSTDGICAGNNKGQVKVLTRDKYYMPPAGIGAAAIRIVNGQVHYLVTLE
jgi:hypothetical protein